jgi:16S rRNA (uracil1498-N3)-methyltransferase
MSQRFFLDSKPSDSRVELGGDQAHHAIHVMRRQIGDSIVLFDGTGVEYLAVIEDLTKKVLTLRIEKTVPSRRTIKTHLELAVALPKGDRQKFLIEKLVELGVSRLIPLKTTRGVSVANAKVVERLKKQVIEASKQCGRNILMEIQPEQTLKQLAASLSPDQLRWIADPNGSTPIGSPPSSSVDSVVVAIGPEGGFDESEIQLARELGFQPIQLGPTILRIETAAIAVASILGIGRE